MVSPTELQLMQTSQRKVIPGQKPYGRVIEPSAPRQAAVMTVAEQETEVPAQTPQREYEIISTSSGVPRFVKYTEGGVVRQEPLYTIKQDIEGRVEYVQNPNIPKDISSQISLTLPESYRRWELRDQTVEYGSYREPAVVMREGQAMINPQLPVDIRSQLTLETRPTTTPVAPEQRITLDQPTSRPLKTKPESTITFPLYEAGEAAGKWYEENIVTPFREETGTFIENVQNVLQGIIPVSEKSLRTEKEILTQVAGVGVGVSRAPASLVRYGSIIPPAIEYTARVAVEEPERLGMAIAGGAGITITGLQQAFTERPFETVGEMAVVAAIGSKIPVSRIFKPITERIPYKPKIEKQYMTTDTGIYTTLGYMTREQPVSVGYRPRPATRTTTRVGEEIFRPVLTLERRGGVSLTSMPSRRVTTLGIVSRDITRPGAYTVKPIISLEKGRGFPDFIFGGKVTRYTPSEVPVFDTKFMKGVSAATSDKRNREFAQSLLYQKPVSKVAETISGKSTISGLTAKKIDVRNIGFEFIEPTRMRRGIDITKMPEYSRGLFFEEQRLLPAPKGMDETFIEFKASAKDIEAFGLKIIGEEPKQFTIPKSKREAISRYVETRTLYETKPEYMKISEYYEIFPEKQKIKIGEYVAGKWYTREYQELLPSYKRRFGLQREEAIEIGERAQRIGIENLSERELNILKKTYSGAVLPKQIFEKIYLGTEELTLPRFKPEKELIGQRPRQKPEKIRAPVFEFEITPEEIPSGWIESLETGLKSGRVKPISRDIGDVITGKSRQELIIKPLEETPVIDLSMIAPPPSRVAKVGYIEPITSLEKIKIMPGYQRLTNIQKIELRERILPEIEIKGIEAKLTPSQKNLLKFISPSLGVVPVYSEMQRIDSDLIPSQIMIQQQMILPIQDIRQDTRQIVFPIVQPVSITAIDQAVTQATATEEMINQTEMERMMSGLVSLQIQPQKLRTKPKLFPPKGEFDDIFISPFDEKRIKKLFTERIVFF